MAVASPLDRLPVSPAPRRAATARGSLHTSVSRGLRCWWPGACRNWETGLSLLSHPVLRMPSYYRACSSGAVMGKKYLESPETTKSGACLFCQHQYGGISLPYTQSCPDLPTGTQPRTPAGGDGGGRPAWDGCSASNPVKSAVGNESNLASPAIGWAVTASPSGETELRRETSPIPAPGP